MTVNHLPGNRELRGFAHTPYGEVPHDGWGFGLGFGVMLDPVRARRPTSIGSFCWGGACSVMFWVDPREELIVIFLSQLIFRDDFAMPLRAWLEQLVYASLKGTCDPLRSALEGWSAKNQ